MPEEGLTDSRCKTLVAFVKLFMKFWRLKVASKQTMKWNADFIARRASGMPNFGCAIWTTGNKIKMIIQLDVRIHGYYLKGRQYYLHQYR